MLEKNNFSCRSKIILIKAILKHSIKIVKNEMNMFKLAVANNYHDITNGELGLSPGFVTSHLLATSWASNFCFRLHGRTEERRYVGVIMFTL